RAEHLRHRIADWFAHVLGRADADDAAILAAGRVAFLQTGAGRRWGEHFLAEDGLPEAMIDALRRAAPRPVPGTTPARMPAQPLVSPSPVAALRRLFAATLAPSGQRQSA